MPNMYKIGKHKTKIVKKDNYDIVIYQNTPIFAISRKEKTLYLNATDITGKPWKTMTTKNRINQALNYYCVGNVKLIQKDFEWYIVIDGYKHIWFGQGVTINLDDKTWKLTNCINAF